jgi:hypothetical protein
MFSFRTEVEYHVATDHQPVTPRPRTRAEGGSEEPDPKTDAAGAAREPVST